MPSRITVVLDSLHFSTAFLILWLWLVIMPGTVARPFSGECTLDTIRYVISCHKTSLTAVRSIRLTGVRALSLFENNIKLLENDSFVSLTELDILRVDKCGMRAIELGAFNGIKHLKKLYITSNEISEILPGTFGNMRNLRHLNLSKNRLERLDSGVFNGLVNLKYLDLGGNKLQYLNSDTFLGLPNIRNISLYGNRGLQVPTDRPIIQSLSLSQLLLSDCNISSLSVATFAQISALERLDLRYNKLRTVDINIPKALPKVAALFLYGNPLHCDCKLQEVWRWCRARNIESAIGVRKPKCYTPRAAKGKWLGDLDKEQCLQSNIEPEQRGQQTKVPEQRGEETKLPGQGGQETKLPGLGSQGAGLPGLGS